MNTNDVVLRQWNPKAKEYFEKEKSNLLKILPECDIHHIGSTAVPGLGGKNIPDTIIVVSDEEKAKEVAKILESNGYYQTSDPGDEHRIFYNIDREFDGKQIHMHAHIMWKTENNYRDTLLFRDYMRKHPEEAKRYYSLKEKWAKEADYTRGRFGKLKAGYVSEIVEKAKNKD